MVLWRLSGKAHAHAFDGGYGLLNDGRWNTVGHPVTYCSTSPALCVLEKLVHIQDPDLLPALVMVRYEVPNAMASEAVSLRDLPPNWQRLEDWTQRRGDRWHSALDAPLLRVPSAIVPLDGSPDVNVVVNHRHPAVRDIRIVATEPFAMDVRLL